MKRNCCFLRKIKMLLVSKFSCFRRREIFGKLSITLYVLWPQFFWHAEIRKKIPLALRVEKRNVIRRHRNYGHAVTNSISVSWLLHVLFLPRGEWIRISILIINVPCKPGLQSAFWLPAVPWLHVLVFFSTWQLHFKKHLRVPTMNTWWSHICMSQGAIWDKAVIFFLYIDYYNRSFLITLLDLLHCKLKGLFSVFPLTFQVFCKSCFF